MATTPKTANVARTMRRYSIAPYPMVVGSLLPDQVNASIQTINSTAVNATEGTGRPSMKPSALPGGTTRDAGPCIRRVDGPDGRGGTLDRSANPPEQGASTVSG